MPVPEWLAVLLIFYAFGFGYVLAIAFEREHKSPFWKGFLDGFTLRRLWLRRRT